MTFPKMLPRGPESLAPSLLRLPQKLQNSVDTFAQKLLSPQGSPPVDFTQPPGEAALVRPDSVSWRIFKNPVALYVGGVAAVILELAEPRVRTGVWEHTSFRTQPVHRLQRTGLAAMVTVYGARSVAEKMIAGVVQRHARVIGHTPGGQLYQANDVELLTWVQATAGFGFAQAYHAWVKPLGEGELDQLYREGAPAAQLYGAIEAPRSDAELHALFDRMRGVLEPSAIVFEFLDIMRRAPVFPQSLRPVQGMLIGAAVEITPDWVRERLGLSAAYGLSAFERRVVRWAGAAADRVMLRHSPAVQACRRLGLPDEYLYRPVTG